MYRVNKIITGLILLSVFIPLLPLNAQDSTNTNNINTIPEGLTALDVINKYVNATGGKENYLSVKDRTTIMTGKMMKREFSVTIHQKAPDKLRQEIQSGLATQTFIFDGTKAVMIMGDNKTPVRDKELSQTKVEAQMNFLLDPEAYGVTPRLVGIETVDSTICYEVTMTTDSSLTWDQFYNTNTGLKIKEIRDIETPQGQFKEESTYGDYKNVKGVMYPFKITQTIGRQTAEMNIDSIMVNTGLDDKLFEIPE